MELCVAYLSDEHDDDQDESNPRAPDAEDGTERQLIEGVAVVFPRRTETDVGQADGSGH